MTTEPERGGNPHQALFYRLGFFCFIASILTGLGVIEQPGLSALCLALALMTVGFFALFTVIHIRH
jgi:hypothetical protein